MRPVPVYKPDLSSVAPGHTVLDRIPQPRNAMASLSRGT
eukprot:COSAG01_NODE_46391_length_400_cov_1.953488_1_plen_38_part_10